MTDKIRTCITCNTDMIVHKNSGKKYCDQCSQIRNREKSREHYRKNILTGSIKEYRKAARERRKLKLQEYPGYDLLCRARNRAQQKGFEFNLSIDDITIPDVCPVLGTSFEKNTYYTMSIDRIDSSKGYVKGNIQVISHKANAMKNSASSDELIKFAKWVLGTYEV